MADLSGKYRYLARNSIALFVGNFASKLLVFFLLPLYTAVLTTEEYAIADLISTTSKLLFVVLSLSVSDAMLRFAMDKKYDKSQILLAGLSVWGMGVPVTVGIGICLYCIPAFGDFADYAVIAVALYLFTALEHVLSCFVKGLEKIRLISVVGVISTGIVTVSNIVMLVLFRWGITGYLLSYVLAHFVACVIYFFAGKVYRYLRVQRLDMRLLKQMLAYSVPLIFTQICWQLDASAAKYIVKGFSDDATVGLLSAAMKIPAVVTMVTTLFTQAWNLSAIKENDAEDSKEFYDSMFEIYMSVIVLGGGALILGSEILGAILLRGDFFVAWRYVPFHILAFVCNSITAFVGSFFLAKKQTKTLVAAVALGAALNIVFNIVLFPRIGLVGTGISATIGYLTISLLRLRKCEKDKTFSYNKVTMLISFVLLLTLSICMTYGKGIGMYVIGSVLFAAIMAVNMPSVFKFVKRIIKR